LGLEVGHSLSLERKAEKVLRIQNGVLSLTSRCPTRRCSWRPRGLTLPGTAAERKQRWAIAGVPSLSRRRVSGARCVRGVSLVEVVELAAARLGHPQSGLDGARGRLYKRLKVPPMHRGWRLRVRLLFRSGRLRLAFRCVELRPSEWRPAEVNRGHRLVPSPDVFCLVERGGRTSSEAYEFGGAMHRPTRRCSRRSRGLRSRDRS
jgi:hypothetical protein